MLFGFQFDPPNTWRHDEYAFISSYVDPVYVEVGGRLLPPKIVNALAVAWTAFFVGGEVGGEKIVATCPLDENPEIHLVQQRDYLKNHEIPNPVMTYRKFDFGNSFVEDSRFVYYRFFAYENCKQEIKKIFNCGEVHHFILHDSNGKIHKVWLIRDDSSEKKFTAVLNENILQKSTVESFFFPVQDGYKSEWRFEDSKFKFLGLYDSFSKFCNTLPPYKKFKPAHFENLPNLSLARLNKGHLLGFHGDGLFKIYKNNFSKVGEGLKNFRLREMKNLKGATK